MKRNALLISALLFSAATGTAVAGSGNSTFQQTCSNISYAYSGNAPAIQAVCLTAAGTPHSTSLVIQGISNQNGNLTNSGGASSFQQSCGNIQVGVTTASATLTAFCRTTSGSSNSTSIPLNGISNSNGNLTY